MAAEERELRTDFTGDADGLVKEAGRAEKALQGVGDEVKDTARQSRLSDDDIDAMGDALADAAKRTAKAEDALRQMRAEIKRLQGATDEAADDMGSGFDRIREDAEEAGRETGEELRSNLAEGLASGDLSSVATDTVAGLVGSLKGGAGMIAGAGLALALALWNAFKAESERLKQRMEAELGFVDLLTGELDKVAEIEDTLTDLGGGSMSKGIELARDTAHRLGLEYEDIVNLLTGDLTPANLELLAALEAQWEAQSGISAEIDKAGLNKFELINKAKEAQQVERETAALIATQRTYMQDTVGEQEKLRAKTQEVLDTIEDIPDPELESLKESLKTAKGDAQRIYDLLASYPTRRRIQLEFYSTGPGADYLNRNSVSYNPGHASIYNHYMNTEREGGG